MVTALALISDRSRQSVGLSSGQQQFSVLLGGGEAGLGKASAFLVLEQRKNKYTLQASPFISWPFSLPPAWNRQVLPRLWSSRHRDKIHPVRKEKQKDRKSLSSWWHWGAAISGPVLNICQLQIKFKIKQNTGEIHEVQIIWNQTHFKVIKYIKTS